MSADQPVEPLKTRTGLLTAVFLAVVLVGFGIARLQARPESSLPGGPMVGRMAPEITVDLFVADGAAGDRWTLSDHLAGDGRPVLLNLFASWCAPCEVEIPRLSAFAERHPEIAVLGAAVRDEESSAREFSARLAPSYPTGIDATGRLRDSMVGFGMPALFLIDETGTVVAQYEGGAGEEQLEQLLDALG